MSTNSAEVEQETEQDNECSELAVCANAIGVQTTTGAAAVTNTGSAFEDLPTALKSNKKQNKKTNVQNLQYVPTQSVSKPQLVLPLLLILELLEDTTNSAEVEQETEQENECETAICANIIGVQAQTGVAAVTNTGNILLDTTNSAEVEQETEQENECETAICANIGVQAQTVAAVTTQAIFF